MNRVIREHYPIERLPEDLRGDLPEQGRVSVEIVLEMEGSGQERHFSRFKDRRHRGFDSVEEIDAHLSALRDEWDRPT